MAQGSKAIISVLFMATTVFFTGRLGIDESRAAATAGITRSNTGGGVTVNVIYPHSQNTDETRFEVVLDTHAVMGQCSEMMGDMGQMMGSGKMTPEEIENMSKMMGDMSGMMKQMSGRMKMGTKKPQ
jgi:hypothetical protein